MRDLKLLGVSLAVCAIGALMASSALALPTVLPEAVENYTGTSSGGTELVAGSTSVKCTGATGEGTSEATSPLGLFHIHFTGCRSSGAECTGESENREVILSLGTYHLVFDALGATLGAAGVAVLFLVGTTKFTCGGLVRVEVKQGGNVLCLIANPTALTKTFTFSCKARGSTTLESKYYNNAGTLVPISTLLTSVSGARAVESSQIGTGINTYTNDQLIMV